MHIKISLFGLARTPRANSQDISACFPGQLISAKKRKENASRHRRLKTLKGNTAIGPYQPKLSILAAAADMNIQGKNPDLIYLGDVIA
jgi:hypothetical protein